MSRSDTGVSPGACERESLRPASADPLREPSAFASGFLASLTGGLLYCVVLFLFYPAELEFAGRRVLTLSLTFGAFEMWRVKRRRTLRSIGTRLCWTVAVSLVVSWALGAILSPADGSREKAPVGSFNIALAGHCRHRSIERA